MSLATGRSTSPWSTPAMPASSCAPRPRRQRQRNAGGARERRALMETLLEIRAHASVAMGIARTSRARGRGHDAVDRDRRAAEGWTTLAGERLERRRGGSLRPHDLEQPATPCAAADGLAVHAVAACMMTPRPRRRARSGTAVRLGCHRACCTLRPRSARTATAGTRGGRFYRTARRCSKAAFACRGSPAALVEPAGFGQRTDAHHGVEVGAFIGLLPQRHRHVVEPALPATSDSAS